MSLPLRTGEHEQIPVRSRMTRAQRRQQLTGIGRSLFAVRGLDGTTIEEIAAAAGVSKPVIYEHFGSKEGLYIGGRGTRVESLTQLNNFIIE